MRNQKDIISILAGVKSISINGLKTHIPYDFEKIIKLNLKKLKHSNDK